MVKYSDFRRCGTRLLDLALMVVALNYFTFYLRLIILPRAAPPSRWSTINRGTGGLGLVSDPLGSPLRDTPGGFQRFANSTARHLPGFKAEAKANGLEGHGPVCHKSPPRN